MPNLRRNDVVLRYDLRGQGPPVLFIQGVSVAGAGWRPQVEGLSDRFQTMTFDNRGLGGSVPCSGPITIEAMAEDARALLDAAGWESAHVVGHSMGGVIAQQLALDCPRRVRSLALLCTFARGKDAARLTPWVLWMTLRTRLGTRAMRRRAFLELIWPPPALACADPQALAAEVAPMLGRDLADQPAVALKQVAALGRHDISARLPELAPIPTFVLSAEQDPIALPRFGRQLAGLIPGARFEEVAGASHGVTLQLPETVNQRLVDFLESVENRGALPGAHHAPLG